MLISIKDVNMFYNLLGTIQKIVPSAKFLVSPEKTVVNSVNDNRSVITSFSSNCIVSGDSTTFDFSIADLSKLQKLIKLLIDSKSLTDSEPTPLKDINFTGSFLMYSSDVSFKLKVVKPEIIENLIGKEANVEITPVFTVKTTANDIRRIIKCISIIDDPDSKVYMYIKDDQLIVELDNRLNTTSNSVGVPLSKDIEGDTSRCVVVALNCFKLFNILPSKRIKIVFSSNNVFEVTASASSIEEIDDSDTDSTAAVKKTPSSTSSSTINMRLLCSAIKG